MSESGPQVHHDEVDESTCKLPGSLDITGGYLSEYSQDDRGKAIVSRLSSFIQERKLKAMQYETTEPSNPPMHQVEAPMTDVQQTTNDILQAILEILTEVQGRLYSVEKRVWTVERDQSKTPPPRTSCGFSCSNNSVNIE